MRNGGGLRRVGCWDGRGRSEALGGCFVFFVLIGILFGGQDIVFSLLRWVIGDGCMGWLDTHLYMAFGSLPGYLRYGWMD